VDRTGGIDPAHAVAYQTFGNWIRACYEKAPVASGALAAGVSTQTITIPAGSSFDRVVLTENQTAGQFVIAWTVEAMVSGAWTPFVSGSTIGAKRISIASAPFAATQVRVTITQAFAPGHSGVTFAVLSGSGCVTA
jgi:hypothetical protein